MLEDSKIEYERSQWEGLEQQLALLAAADEAIPELDEDCRVVLERPAAP